MYKGNRKNLIINSYFYLNKTKKSHYKKVNI